MADRVRAFRRPSRRSSLSTAALLVLALGVGAPGSSARPVEDDAIRSHGWTFSWSHTDSDGIAVYAVRFQGRRVLARASVPQCEVDYADDDSDMQDQLGANIPLVPGSTALQETPGYVSLSAVYECCSFPLIGSYRYRVAYRFHNDGRFEPAVEVFGSGIWPRARYRCHLRLDVDLGSAGGHVVAQWNGVGWERLDVEGASADGERAPGGARWRVRREGTGLGLHVSPGEHDDGSSTWLLEYVPSEAGALATPTFPSALADGDAIAGADVVLWYVAALDFVRTPTCPPACPGTRIGPVLTPAFV